MTTRIRFIAAVAMLMLLAGAPAALAADEHRDAPLSDALNQFSDAIDAKDAGAMARFYFADGDTDGRLARANAQRILLALALKQAIVDHLDKNDRGSLVEKFGLYRDLDRPVQYQTHENGDTAVAEGRGDEQPAVWFKKINGAWKQDISPPPPHTAAERAQDMEEDSAAMQKIATAIDQGAIKSFAQLRDALGNAMLNATPDDMFARDMRLEEEFDKDFHNGDRADPHGVFPYNPATPAGAMNRFLRAVQNGDEATLRDSLELSKDSDGSVLAAVTHDLVTGTHLLAAAEGRFTDEEQASRICHWLGVIDRGAMRGYTDEEWAIEPAYPNLAFTKGLTVPTTAMSEGKPVPVHESRMVPVMHHDADGRWRIGRRFPLNARQRKFTAAALAQKDALLEQAASDLRAGKYKTDAEVVEAIGPQLQKLGLEMSAIGSPLP